KTLKDAEGGEALADVRARLARGLADVQGIFMALMGKMGESLYHVGLQGNRVLAALAEIVIGWLLVRHAAIAQGKLDDGAKGSEADFYRGKVASARWFCRNVLPGLTLTRKLVEDSALELMELPDGAF
ncbi:MAG: acyl-CoA dehydrogenase C-terminal domain-containing protein, partial [Myxococcales bacterium]|nr:acyl-CoA dehydrogenase C-terminal domain-containing protein [Myxococcales bacterium]